MIRTLIIPGYRGSDAGHWQRHWADDLPETLVVEQESFDRPSLAAWLQRLEAHLANSPGSILVAHSLGCALVAHVAARASATHVAGALLVAPADVDLLAEREAAFCDFAPMPLAKLPFPATVVASRNDPFMTFSRAKALAGEWGASLVDLGDAGHINIASGYGPWPEGPIIAEALRGRKNLGAILPKGRLGGPALRGAASLSSMPRARTVETSARPA